MTPDQQLAESAAKYGLKPEDLTGKSRRSDVMAARRHFAHALFNFTEDGYKVYSMSTIRETLNYKSTSAVSNLLWSGGRVVL